MADDKDKASSSQQNVAQLKLNLAMTQHLLVLRICHASKIFKMMQVSSIVASFFYNQPCVYLFSFSVQSSGRTTKCHT